MHLPQIRAQCPKTLPLFDSNTVNKIPVKPISAVNITVIKKDQTNLN